MGDAQLTEGVLAGVAPGSTVGLVGPAGSGLTRLGLVLLAGYAATGPVAYLDARGWLCPSVAWDAGIGPDRLVVVRCDDVVRWSQVAATLVEGVRGVYAEVPAGVKEPVLRRLGALARARRTPLVLRPLRGGLPAGLAHLRLEARSIVWEGAGDGHGRLERRRFVVHASGKAMRGMERIIEVEDDGANAVRVVPGLVAAPAGRAAG